ncbi:right-handed parallel beta-helix repeat-containing protein [Chlorogloeopsis fritschii]|uniref:right-handed parallel beta-helix repeat-containing protein n=1 Tax=Chlorogloeopsis fritschii TaxID=1124 RepID=UPI0023F47674|nr:right-handed parallel beta-helix repeat-containing protein [Chlorogloeopsis fritschii]
MLRRVYLICLVLIGTLVYPIKGTAESEGQTDSSNLTIQDFIELGSQSLKSTDATKITGANIDESKVSQIIYVSKSTEASDTNDGSQKNPLLTIGAALEKARGYLSQGISTKIALSADVYREGSLKIDYRFPKVPDGVVLVIEGQGSTPTVIKGSELVPLSAWTPTMKTDKGLIYRIPWNYDFGNNGGPYGKYGPKNILAHRRELVFVNGKQQRQVLLEKYKYTFPNAFRGTGSYEYLEFVEPQDALQHSGSFGVAEKSENGDFLYLLPNSNVNFKSATIEVGVHPFLMRFYQVRNVVLRNISFRHSVGALGGTAAVIFGEEWNDKQSLINRNILIDQCRFEWNNYQGLYLFKTQDVTVKNSVFNYNGFMGTSSDNMINGLWIGNSTNFNNWRGNLSGWRGWAISGAKHHFAKNVLFKDQQAIGNLTSGMWFDHENKNVVIDNFVAVKNSAGLFLEVSPGPFLVKNSFISDSMHRAGIDISNAQNITILDSVIANNPNQIALVGTSRYYSNSTAYHLGEVQEISNVPVGVGPIAIRNSLISSETSNQMLFFANTGNNRMYTSLFQNNYESSNNIYWAPEPKSFLLEPDYPSVPGSPVADIEKWKLYTGDNGQWIEPNFTSPEIYDYNLSNLEVRSYSMPEELRQKLQSFENFVNQINRK